MSPLSFGRRGTSLVEVLGYVAFAAALLGPMLRMEIVARRATAEQAALLVLDREWSRTADALGGDLRSASSVRAEDDGKALRIIRTSAGKPEEVLYRIDPDAPGRLARKSATEGSAPGRTLSLHARSVAFRREGATWVADVSLSNVVQGRTLERAGRIVRTPRAEAAAAEQGSP